MKRNLFAIFLALALVVALAFVVAPSAKAAPDVVKAEEDGPIAVAAGQILDLNGHNVTVENPVLGYGMHINFMINEIEHLVNY